MHNITKAVGHVITKFTYSTPYALVVSIYQTLQFQNLEHVATFTFTGKAA